MSALLDAIMGLGSGVLDALDMPGSYLRGALAGRPGDRLSGQEMLSEWGMDDPGAAMGFGAELIADPLNILGGAGLAIKAIRNPIRRFGNKGQLDDVLRGLSGTQEDSARFWVDQTGTELLPKVEQHIPPGSKFLGAGSEALVVETPKGDVLKLLTQHPIGMTDPKFAIPPKISGVLQPKAMRDFGDYAVHVYPKANQVPLDEADDVIDLLRKQVGDTGYDFWDADWQNIGLHKGNPVIVDAGSVNYPSGVIPPNIPSNTNSPLLAALLAYNTANTVN